MSRALIVLVALTCACASSASSRSETTTTTTVGAPPRVDPEGEAVPERTTTEARRAEHPTLGASWQVQPADRICVRGRELEITRSCTCGEPHACDAIRTAAGIDVRVAIDSEGPAICDDCYPTTVRCTLPEVTCEGSLAIAVNGAPATDAATGPGCTLTDGACWDLAR